MPKFPKNTSPAMYKKPSTFKMKGSPMQRNFGISPIRKELKGTTVFGHEVSKIKDKVVNKAKKIGRKAELAFDSGIYSNTYKASKDYLYPDAKINQPRFSAEKKELLKKSKYFK